MAARTSSTAPRGLKTAGRSLWKAIHEDLGAITDAEGRPLYVLDARELALLEAACRQADDVALLEAVIAKGGVTSVGSKGQVRVAGAVTEARQGRLALGRLLGDLKLPDADDVPRSAASRRAQGAAQARWTPQIVGRAS